MAYKVAIFTYQSAASITFIIIDPTLKYLTFLRDHNGFALNFNLIWFMANLLPKEIFNSGGFRVCNIL